MSFEGSLGLRGQLEDDVKSILCVEVLEESFLVKLLPIESEVTLGEALVIDFVFVVRCHSDCFEACGLVNDCAV